MAKMSKEQFVAKMAEAKAAKKMAAAMAETIVSTEALEIAVKSEEEMAKMENTKKAATKKTAAKAEKIAKWLAKAKLDENGKYLIVAEYDYKGYAENAGWNPCYYIVTTELTLTRIGATFAVELAEQGKAVEITKEQVKAGKKTTKKAQVELDDDSSFDEVLDLIPSWQDFADELVG